MAKNLCGLAVMEAVQAPGLPRYLISRLQLVLAPPQEQRPELLPAAIALELEPQPPAVAADSNPQVVPQVFLEPALESFPALALLFFRLISPSQFFCLLIRFSFAMFSSHPSALALGWETFSTSLKQQSTQASPSVLALVSPHLPHQTLSPCCYAMILFALPAYRFCRSTLLLPALPWGWDSVISRVSGTHSVSSSICFPHVWFWQPALVISSGLGMKKRASRFGFFRIRRLIFPRCSLAREGECRRLHRERMQLRAKGESAPLRLSVTEHATRSTESRKKVKELQRLILLNVVTF